MHRFVKHEVGELKSGRDRADPPLIIQVYRALLQIVISLSSLAHNTRRKKEKINAQRAIFRQRVLSLSRTDQPVRHGFCPRDVAQADRVGLTDRMQPSPSRFLASDALRSPYVSTTREVFV
jgi:hypothetical protein